MKTILIDALHITMGGGKGLLEYLVSSLLDNNIVFVLLKDYRCGYLKREKEIPNLVIIPPSHKARKSYYVAHKNDFYSILCFGNIPAPIKMPCPVHTYVHNINLIRIPSDFSIKMRIKLWLKRTFIIYFAKNTDSWIVQTQNMDNLLRKCYPCKNQDVLQLPFYYLPQNLVEEAIASNVKTDYCLIGGYTYNRGHEELLEAWKILHNKGIDIPLHITVKTHGVFGPIAEAYTQKGILIINHGEIPHEEVFQIFSKCKAIVYPSHGESFGLGIIEAISSGCDVIGSDAPYLHTICTPSIIFKMGDAISIANAIEQYETQICQNSKIKTSNKISELLKLLTNNYYERKRIVVSTK